MQAITAPTSLNFVLARVEAPLGLLMLAAIGMRSIFFLLMLARSEIAMLLESLRTAVLNELAEINRKLDAMPGRSLLAGTQKEA